MKYKAIFFDLDGTLLPCDLDIFTKAYFTELAKVLAPYGYGKEELVAAIWGGTKKMYKTTELRPTATFSGKALRRARKAT